jgi:hypothetical protein
MIKFFPKLQLLVAEIKLGEKSRDSRALQRPASAKPDAKSIK